MLEAILKQGFIEVFTHRYGQQAPEKLIQFQKTRAGFEGDYTVNVFPLLKISRQAAELTAENLGRDLCDKMQYISRYNVVKGFLNLVIADAYWFEFFKSNIDNPAFGTLSGDETESIVIEYSSPNTNKPLHLGHIRNNLLGWSLSEILKAAGNEVFKVNLVNDRGIHICKSMLAWQKWGKGRTPENTGMKGDKLVGEMYVLFDNALKEETDALIRKGYDKDTALAKSVLMAEAREMLRKWEAGDEAVTQLWQTMNQWVYAGFDATYNRLGVDFDKVYHESETYILGKELVLQGLAKKVFFQKEDGSVWCDMADEGLDEKLLLRADGTSVYMTQDLGTANLRFADFKAGKMIYVVGNEQNYHFDVLKRIGRKLDMPWAETIEHLSYGMVELPEGKMKSREGKVVDADDLMDEVTAAAEKMTRELGKLENMDGDDAQNLFRIIGLGALKYFMLKVDPKKTMLFNPAESVDLNGNTGPFIQYTHARIQSVQRKAVERGIAMSAETNPPDLLAEKEKSLLVMLHAYPLLLQQAASNRSPALVANYLYDLAKEFNQFYQECPILPEADENRRQFRLKLSQFTGRMIRQAGSLLGIEMPEKM